MAKWRRTAHLGSPDSLFDTHDKKAKLRRNRLSERKLRLEPCEERKMFAVSPQLIAIIPNEGQNINLGGGDTLMVAPRELTIRFDEGQIIDPATLAANISIVRADFDDNLNDDTVPVTLGYVGIGDRSNEVVVRFASNLPDDRYRVRIAPGLTNTEGDQFNNGVARNVEFNLNLGAQIVAVVPQPVTRLPNGKLQQATNQIVIYFNEDTLSKSAAENLSYYQVIRTNGTATNTDDTVFNPTNAVYDNLTNKVTLTFAANVLETAGAFRLRVGNNDPIPAVPQTVAVSSEVGSSFADADLLGSIFTGSGLQSVQLSSAIDPMSFYGTNWPYSYQTAWPGGNDDPGHRDIPAESHIGTPDSSEDTAIIYYNFLDVYGTDPFGNLLHNLITEEQKQRAREIFSFYSEYAGVQFIESTIAVPGARNFVVVTGDLRANSPTIPTGPGGTAGLAGTSAYTLLPTAIMDNAENWNNEYGGSWQSTAMHEIGHLLGLGHTYDLPGTAIMGSYGSPTSQVPSGETRLPGDSDIIHMQRLYRPDSTDIDVYGFKLTDAGTISLETIAQRLTTNTQGWLDSVISVFDASGKLIGRNDDYYGKDSFLQLDLTAGDYYVAITASGNTAFDPHTLNTGMGGRSHGRYDLRMNFSPTSSTTGGLVDTTNVLFDGDYDGTAGGEYNFWFKTQNPTVNPSQTPGANRVIWVDKAYSGTTSNGTLADPYKDIRTAMGFAKAGDIVRVVGNGGADGDLSTVSDNLSYNIGFNTQGGVLSDGATLEVPQGVTLMIDAGAIFRMRGANIDAGSSAEGLSRSGSAIQVLGTPESSVYFTSYHDESLGKDLDIINTTPANGDWGGLVFRGDSDLEQSGIFLNYVNHADIRYGGGQVVVNSRQDVYNPIHMIDARPTLGFNRITRSADAAMSADPNSFEESTFQTANFVVDYGRVGPSIYGNTLFDNSINALFVRVKTNVGENVDRLTRSARFDDTDIVHVFSESLLIAGDAGGARLVVPTPTLAIDSVSLTEGNAATKNFTFTVRLSSPTDKFVTTNFSTTGITATAGSDFNATNGVLTFAPGQTSKTITVAVRGDTSVELGETFRVTLSGSVNAAIAPGASFGTGTIINDDGAAPTISIGSATTFEGNTDSFLSFPVTLSSPALVPVTVVYSVMDGSATSTSGDFVPTSGTLTFAPGQVQQFVSVKVLGDLVNEDTETFSVLLSNSVGATISAGTATGTIFTDDVRYALQPRVNGRLAIDPGVVVKLSGARIEMEPGAQFLAEGTAENPIIFTSLSDDRFGRGSTFDTTNDDASTSEPQPRSGDWGGIYFSGASTGSIDHSLITFAGGDTAVEGEFGRFNAVEIQQAEVRIANSTFEQNAGGRATGNRSGRLTNDEATIFIRGAQPDIVNNIIRNNAGPAISIDVSSMNVDRNNDSGRSTGAIDVFGDFFTNVGPLVTGNRLDNNKLNGLVVRGGTVNTESVWDDTSIVHIVQDEIVSTNFHTFGGIRLQSKIGQSLVVKLSGPNAGFTAMGRPLDTDDRLGGMVQIMGVPGAPVVLTSLGDDTVGAGLKPDGSPQTDTDNDALPLRTEVPGNFKINLNVGDALQANPSVLESIQRAVAYWESVIQDPITVNLNANFGDTGTAAGTGGPNSTFVPYGTLRNAMIADGGAHERDLLNQLPLPANFTATGANGAVINTSNISVSRSIAKALDLLDRRDTGTDGRITFAFGSDVPDGDVYEVALHEIGHAMGFISGVNGDPSDIPMVQDLFRVAPGTGKDFSTTTRVFDTSKAQVFYDGGRFNPAGIDIAGIEMGEIPLSTGTDGWSPSHWKNDALPEMNGIYLGIMDPSGPGGVTANDKRALDLMGFDLVSAGVVGDWRSIKIDEFSNDRNVEVVNELEQGFLPSGDTNNLPSKAQFLGVLAPNERSGDDIARLGFQIQGSISQTIRQGAGDVDVYSFQAKAGTTVYFDIDRTNFALDTVLELVDANGIPVAVSDDSLFELRGFGNPVTGKSPLFSQDDRTLLMSTSERTTNDFYATNDRDAGMRVVLPGATGSTNTYYVRVRSYGSALTSLTGGETKGVYQLQIRLQDMDEIPGSLVQYADIRFATNGIEVIGKPEHSPILGDAAESSADNDTYANAQDIGNLLVTDRMALTVAGVLGSPTDIDFFKFTVDYDFIQSIAGVNAGGKTFAAIFDIDYADGMSRPDTVISVFDETGKLILVSRDSDVADDQGSSPTNLAAGSFGKQDAYIGPVQLPEGTVTNADGSEGASLHTYYVAVSSNRQLPQILDATFNSTATSPLVRLEPVNSTMRIIEDHIEDTSPTGYSTYTPPKYALNLTPTQFHLGDVVMYVATSNKLYTVDPLTGAVEYEVTNTNGRMGTATANGQIRYGDVIMRNDGRLYTFTQGTNDGNSGNYQEINTGNGSVLNAAGDDGMITLNAAFETNAGSNVGVQYNAMSFIQNGPDNRRLFVVGNRGGGVPANSNLLVELDPNTGGNVDDRGSQIWNPIDSGGNRSRTNLVATELLVNLATIFASAATDTSAPFTSDIIDGQIITVTDNNGNSFVLEFDAGLDLLLSDANGDNLLDSQVVDGHTFSIDGVVFEFTTDVTIAPTSNFAVNVISTDDIVVIRQAMADAIDTAFGVGTASVARNRISVEGAATFDPQTSSYLQNRGNGAGVAAGDAIVFGAASTAAEIATAIQQAINGAGVNFTASVLAGDKVQLTPTVPADVVVSIVSSAPSIVGVHRAISPLVTSPGIGTITGMTTMGGQLYVVTDTGGLYRVNNPGSDGNTRNATLIPIATLQDVDGLPIAFSGLTAGPANVEDGKYANIMFATDSTGRIHALDTLGVLQPIFLHGATNIETGLGAVGVTFSTLDYNLWHKTNMRRDDAGHGLVQSFDGDATRVNRPVGNNGGQSYYFGLQNFEPGNLVVESQPGIRNYETNSGVYNTYDLPGGAYGSLISGEFSLEGYSATDKPTLYFNYFLDTEERDTPTNQLSTMRDSFRVFISTDDGGSWSQLVTNNSTLSTANAKTELARSKTTSGGLYRGDRPDQAMQEAFDNTDAWRQARIDLGDFAGAANVRLRFDFSTAGGMNVGNIDTVGDWVKAVAGEDLRDGATFTLLDGRTQPPTPFVFEFDKGYTLAVPAGGSSAIAEGETFTITGPSGTQTFEFTHNAVYSGPNTPIRIGHLVTAKDVASAIGTVLNGAANLTGVKVHVKGERIDLGTYNPTADPAMTIDDRALFVSQSADPGLILEGDPAGSVSDPSVISIKISGAMADTDVAAAIARTMDARFSAGILDREDLFTSAKVDQAFIHLPGWWIQDAGPLPFSTNNTTNKNPGLPDPTTFIDPSALPGDGFMSQVGNQGVGAFGDRTRAQNNRHEGVYIDDIMIGFAERGEMVTGNVGDTNSNFFSVPPINDGLGRTEVTAGPYTLEVRKGTEYGVEGSPSSYTMTPIDVFRTFDTNERFSTGMTLIAPSGADIQEGQTIRISNGTATLSIEFNSDGVLNHPEAIAFSYSAADSAASIAARLASTINSQTSFNVTAIARNNGNQIDLFGAVASDFFDDRIALAARLSGLELPDGATFRLSNGLYIQSFEFDNNFLLNDPSAIAIPFSSSDSAETIAARAALYIDNIGSATGIDAFSIGTTIILDGVFGVDVTSGAVPSPLGTTAGLSASSVTNYWLPGTPTGGLAVRDKEGDTNRFRDQGYTIIRNNSITAAAGFGILVEPADRSTGDTFPRPGAPLNQRAANSQRLVPGISISNNVIAYNVQGGISFSGDPDLDPAAAVPFGRIVNNTFYGFGSEPGVGSLGVGVLVGSQAGPTIMNNIFANFQTGVQVAGSSAATTVLGANLYQGNTTNRVGAGETFNIDLGLTEPLFVDAANGNFYLKALSRAIDSSRNSLDDRPSLQVVTNPLGIPASPILAPSVDFLGQLRVDDPAVQSVNIPGQGQNVFKDRGAIDRADFSGPSVSLLNPLDNDSGGLDTNPSPTSVRIAERLNNFSFRFTDGSGTGIDDGTVTLNTSETPGNLIFLRNGVPVPSTLFNFTYDSTTDTARFQATEGFFAAGVYTLEVVNSDSDPNDNIPKGVRDIANNFLIGNQQSGRTVFTIEVISAAAPWQNPANQFDVSGNGVVSPLDLGMLVDLLQRKGNQFGDFPPPLPLPQTPGPTGPFYDVNGNGRFDAADMLLLVQELNRIAQGLASSFESSETETILPPEPTSIVSTSDPEVAKAAAAGSSSNANGSIAAGLAMNAGQSSAAKSSTTTGRATGTIGNPAITDSVWADVGRQDEDFSPYDDALAGLGEDDSDDDDSLFDEIDLLLV